MARRKQRLVNVHYIDHLEDARILIQSVQCILIDARPTQAYTQAHLKDAISLPGMQLDTNATRHAYDNIIPNWPILIYCSDPRCPLANNTARFLQGLGFTHIVIFSPGWSQLQQIPSLTTSRAANDL